MSNPCILCKTCKETNPDVVFHRFPRTKTRCQRWLNALQLDVLKNKTPRELYKSFRLCSNHFSSKNYLTGGHYPGLLGNACPDQNLDPDHLPLSTAAAENTTSEYKTPSNLLKDSDPDNLPLSTTVTENTTSEYNSTSNLPQDSEDQRCSQRKRCAPSDIQIIQEVCHPTSHKGPRPWRYQEASASSSTLQSSAATCNSSYVPSRARHQMVCKTNEHSHAEEHVGPFRFTDPITTIENKGGLQRTNLPLQRDSESDASETEETICEMVSQSTQTNTSAPNGTLHLSAPPSQAKTKETKVMNLPESEAKAVKFGQDEATSQKKETKDPVDTETSPVAH
ncbi:Eukaryotic translation initiation factor 4B [Penaeus vannamei]|uniref:Eukaryotic translation initiation factor 4B n=1 Tax=Penaeus vannamei TaxID=6689 RepID=A0A423TTL4_PENVA|nr:Eukaryotic translation initiation factor 4B [Penaeus vannamei]